MIHAFWLEFTHGRFNLSVSLAAVPNKLTGWVAYRVNQIHRSFLQIGVQAKDLIGLFNQLNKAVIDAGSVTQLRWVQLGYDRLRFVKNEHPDVGKVQPAEGIYLNDRNSSNGWLYSAFHLTIVDDRYASSGVSCPPFRGERLSNRQHNRVVVSKIFRKNPD